MRYWWVNQNQTYRHEISGGYLWSPKRNANKARNPFYESMREVAPGDIIFSFRDTRIAALGIARSFGRVSGWRISSLLARCSASVPPRIDYRPRESAMESNSRWAGFAETWPISSGRNVS